MNPCAWGHKLPGNMAMVISVRSKLVTAAVVTGFGLALILIIGSVLGWFENRTFDHSIPSYGLHQRLAASNISQVRLDYLQQSPRHFAWKLSARVSQTVRPYYLSHMIAVATLTDQYWQLHLSDCRNTQIISLGFVMLPAPEAGDIVELFLL